MRGPAIVGVDTGGTFTDLVIRHADGGLSVRKLPSTPRDPSQSVRTGIAECLADGLIEPGFTVVHGTTVGTNALLQRRGAHTALVTTRGFRDVLEIGRQARTHLYAFHPTKPIPLLPRTDCYELDERLDWQGNVLTPLDEKRAVVLLDELKARKYESLAVCFLFSYLNPVHERLFGRLALACGLAVSLSCDIAPEPREYERASTTAANAFIAPLMTHYLTNLQTQLTTLGAARLRVMQSNGGALSAEEAAHKPITTALSGPAGGIVAAAQIGAQAGFADLLTFDMGGTSTDVALIVGGQCPVVTTGGMGDLPLRTPLLDIHTVGAGGGSLARVDRAGGLRAGPESAGADPGPVAYGRGEILTVTDANVLLGRLPANIRLAGRVSLDGSRVRTRFEVLAHEIKRTPEQTALGIVAVANAAMARALRHVSVERGHDPAGLTLLAFGGAGGLHACALASALDMTTILIPPYPGAFSALGLALADVRREYVQALPPTRLPGEAVDIETAPHIVDILNGVLSDLRTRAVADAATEGLAPGAWQWQALLDVHYVGQSFELRTPLTPFTMLNTNVVQNTDAVQSSERVSQIAEFQASALNTDLLGQTAAAFHALHAQRFGYANAQEPVEVTAVRLLAVGTARLETEQAEDTRDTRQDPMTLRRQSSGSIASARTLGEVGETGTFFVPGTVGQNRKIHTEEGWREATVFQRSAFVVGQTFSGPALVLQEDATTYVAPGWNAHVDAYANLILRHAERNSDALNSNLSKPQPSGPDLSEST